MEVIHNPRLMSMLAGPWPWPAIFAKRVSCLAGNAIGLIKSRMLKPRQFLRALVALSAGVLSGFVSLNALAAPPAGVLDDTHANVRAVMAVQQEVTADWMRDPTVLGTAVGLRSEEHTSEL